MLPAIANIVWPALILEERLLSVWVIVAGLLIELPVVCRITQFDLRRAIRADLVMNAVSALAGILCVPISGILWELVSSVTIQPLFHVGTFYPAAWIATGILAALTNAVLEAGALCLFFKQPFTKSTFLWLCGVNAVTVSLALISLYCWPGRS